MPKIIDYPRASLTRSLALAEAVDKLGGEASEASVADHMGNKVGGAFNALVGAAVKFALVSKTSGRIKTEPLYQDYKLAYTDTQKQEAIRRSFLSAPLFAELAQRLNGQSIPSHFEKLIIREHDVPEDWSSRIAGYFEEGAKAAGVLGANGIISTTAALATGTGKIFEGTDSAGPVVDDDEGDPPEISTNSFVRSYSVRIMGPGIDSRISIRDEDDVDIVESMLKKVRKLMKAQQDTEGGKSGG